jgi:hypothetical protein
VLEMVGIAPNYTLAAVSQYGVLMGRAQPDAGRIVYAEGGYATYEPNSFEGRCNDPNQPGICDPTNIYYPKGLQEQQQPLSVCRSTMVRTGAYKLVRRSDPQSAFHYDELYDLTADPSELANRFNDPALAAVQANLTAQLLTWYVQTSDVTPWDEQSRSTPHGQWPGPTLVGEEAAASSSAPRLWAGSAPVRYAAKTPRQWRVDTAGEKAAAA